MGDLSASLREKGALWNHDLALQCARKNFKSERDDGIIGNPNEGEPRSFERAKEGELKTLLDRSLTLSELKCDGRLTAAVTMTNLYSSRLQQLLSPWADML